MRSLELRVPPPLQAAVALTLILLLGWWIPTVNVPFPGHRVVAIAAIVFGVLVAAAGIVAFRRARTTLNPHDPSRTSSIVDGGIFRFTRNPMYLGLTMTLLGVTCWRGTWLGLLVIAGFVAYITRFQIEPEERMLSARFGDAYLAYRARVRRWL